VPGLAAPRQPPLQNPAPVRSVGSLINYTGRPLQKELVLELSTATVLRRSVAVTVSRPDGQVCVCGGC
jgi:hypothetical protein